MSDGEYKAGRFKVSAAPSTESTSIGRFRLIPQGSPFLQRGRFSAIPEEESSPAVSRQGPEITVDPSPEWDFQVSCLQFPISLLSFVEFAISRQNIWISTPNSDWTFFSPHSSEKVNKINRESTFNCVKFQAYFRVGIIPAHCVVFVRLLWQSTDRPLDKGDASLVHWIACPVPRKIFLCPTLEPELSSIFLEWTFRESRVENLHVFALCSRLFFCCWSRSAHSNSVAPLLGISLVWDFQL